MSGCTLTFDLGQTGFRARIHHGDSVLAETSGPGHRSGTLLRDALVDMTREVAQITGIDRFDRVVGGTTGVYGHVPDLSDAAEALARRSGTVELIVADDAVTSALGALGADAGVTVAVGTGLVALACGGAGALARVDGNGAMAGDEGSGWWIGRQGLIAALSAVDGRDGGSAALLAAAQGMFGPAATIPAAVATAASPIAAVAGFAREVAAVARDGDPVARAIWAEAARHIGAAVAAAAGAVHLAAPIAYAVIGGVSRSLDLLEPHLTDELARRIGPTRREIPHGSSLDGADRLLTLGGIEGLAPLVRTTALTKGGT